MGSIRISVKVPAGEDGQKGERGSDERDRRHRATVMVMELSLFTAP